MVWNSGIVSVLCWKRLWVVMDLKRRYTNSLNEWIKKPRLACDGSWVPVSQIFKLLLLLLLNITSAFARKNFLEHIKNKVLEPNTRDRQLPTWLLTVASVILANALLCLDATFARLILQVWSCQVDLSDLFSLFTVDIVHFGWFSLWLMSFVTFPGLKWSTYNSRLAWFTIDLLTRDIERRQWSIADTSNNHKTSNRSIVLMQTCLGWYLRMTLLHLHTFRHLPWAGETQNCCYLSNCEMFDIKTNIFVHKWL